MMERERIMLSGSGGASTADWLRVSRDLRISAYYDPRSMMTEAEGQTHQTTKQEFAKATHKQSARQTTRKK
jgi:hypothetical protein